MTVIVGIVIAVIVILAALVMMGIIPGLEQSKTFEGYFYSCCTAYMIGGHCNEGESNYAFQCSISTDIVSSGKISISDLAGRVGVPVESCCK